MESFEKLLKTIRVEAMSRITNPSLAAFYLAFLVINWEFWIIALAADIQTQSKISLILGKIHIWKVLWLPAIISAIYTLISPATAFVANFIWSFARTKINIVQRHYDKQSYLSLDKSLKIKFNMFEFDKKYMELFKEISEVKEEYKGELEKREKENKDSAEKIKELKSQNAAIIAEKDKYQKEFNAVQLKLLGSIANTDMDPKELELIQLLIKEDKMLPTVISNHLGISLSKGKYFLDRLSEQQMVLSVGGGHYSLSPLGRKFYFEKIENKGDVKRAEPT